MEKESLANRCLSFTLGWLRNRFLFIVWVMQCNEESFGHAFGMGHFDRRALQFMAVLQHVSRALRH